MQDTVSVSSVKATRLSSTLKRWQASLPTGSQWLLAALSAILLILAFPDFDLWPLAWVALVPLLIIAARAANLRQAFLLGWLTGTLFFYGSCYWATYSMIHYGGLPSWLAYALLVPAAAILGFFPALCCVGLRWTCASSRHGSSGIWVAPFLWVALEWTRLGVTGSLWNAVGYSQAYVPELIQGARWGGVYAVSFMIVATNAALAYLLLARRRRRALTVSALAVGAVALLCAASARLALVTPLASVPSAVVIGIQPNVAVDFTRSPAQTAALVSRHLMMSHEALRALSPNLARLPRLVVWPESPMNFSHARDSQFRETVRRFAQENRASVLFNSIEPAPLGGAYNSAVMVDEAGLPVAQYDKIRLLPFGEYVPLPRWLPGAAALGGIVGDFTVGTKYPLMPVAENSGVQAGVFICIEAAYPFIAGRFARDGADVLINISNDGYLGPTPVMRQHLANAIFRAVENNRPVLRVTNTGISALISAHGNVVDPTEGFEPAVRSWTVGKATGTTFYTQHDSLFVFACVAISILWLLTTLNRN